MRVIGLGFDEYKAAWSSSKNEDIGTLDDLRQLLQDILMEEDRRRRASLLPLSVVVPQMRRKTFKELGTPTVQAEELATKVISVADADLLRRAQVERQRLVEAGEVDDVGDNQPLRPPNCDDNLVGAMLEVRWRYWEKVVDPQDKRKKKAVDIWCEGEVVQVATHLNSSRHPHACLPYYLSPLHPVHPPPSHTHTSHSYFTLIYFTLTLSLLQRYSSTPPCFTNT